MAGVGYLPMKLKRKDLDQVNDEFSDFSLSSPARKIRRLDAELPPIMEEEEPEIPVAYEQPMPMEEQHVSGGPVIEEMGSVPINEERAIVLFKPVNAPLPHSPSNLSVSVDSNIISGFKNEFLRSSFSENVKSADDEAAMQNEKNMSANGCLAVVPWVPYQLPHTQSTEEVSQTEVPDLMEADEMGEANMDIEDDNNVSIQQQQKQIYEFGGVKGSEGLHQWPQQHCMIPQPPENTSTPITWFR